MSWNFHAYVVTVVNSVMTVTMDGYELFSGTVSLPPAAFLGFAPLGSLMAGSLAGTFTAPRSIAAMAVAAIVINSVIYSRGPKLGEIR